MEHENIAPVRFDQLERCAAVIRESFATVAEEFGITEQNCPNHTRFIKAEKLEKEFATGYLLYAYYTDGKIIGFAALSDAGGAAYELHHIAVLPEHRHKGAGRELLDFCVQKVKEFGGTKLILSMIEENTRIKEWYAAYGFIHTGTKKFAHLPFTSGYMELEV